MQKAEGSKDHTEALLAAFCFLLTALVVGLDR
jgi:hypothetical protein